MYTNTIISHKSYHSDPRFTRLANLLTLASNTEYSLSLPHIEYKRSSDTHQTGGTNSMNMLGIHKYII